MPNASSKTPSNQSLSIAHFEDKEVRRYWNVDEEKWYLSIIDVVGAISESSIPSRYWNDLKAKLKDEGFELYDKIVKLNFVAKDGKKRPTECADVEVMLRIIQSVPSPKAEPLKQWLARVGYERIEETRDPEKAFDRAMATYLRKGYSPEWVNQRLQTIKVRKELTDEWQARGVKAGAEYAELTDILTHAWSGMRTKDYKAHKGLKGHNLRDHMSTLELVLNMLAEATTTEITKAEDAKGIHENRTAAHKGGTIAGNARRQIEEQTKKPVVSSRNHLPKSRGKKQVE